MTISELITALQAAQAEHGDGPVKKAEVSFMEGTSQLVTLRYEYHFEMHERFDREDAPVGYVGVSGATDDTEAFQAAQRQYPGYFVGKLVGKEAQ
jgi:hypothetical protein